MLRSVTRVNGPSTGSVSITLLGRSFGSTNYTPKSRIGGSPTEVTLWTTDTSAVVKTNAGIGDAQQIVLTVFENEGTFTLVYTYDSPVPSGASWQNGPTTGEVTITIVGRNFGAKQYSPRGRLGATTCASSSWVSDSALSCKLPRGRGAITGASVSLNSVVAGSMSAGFSYDVPLVSRYAGACLGSISH